MVQSQLASASSTPSPKPSNSEAFLCTNPLPFLPAPKCQNHQGRQFWWPGQALPVCTPERHALPPAICGNTSAAGRETVGAHCVVRPPTSRDALGPPSSTQQQSVLTVHPPMAPSLPVVVKTGSSSCSSFPGRAGSWSHCPKPHMFNPSKEK